MTWDGLRPTWTGWDGSVWDLSDRASGVLLARGGTRGLSMPPVRRYASAGPAVAGSRYRGNIAEEREVFWPLHVLSSPGEAFASLERDFWRTMHPDRQGTWTITAPDGSSRYLRLRFVDDGAHAFDVLPVKFGRATYGITLVAEQPFWEGAPTVRRFEPGAAVPFYSPTGAYIFALSPDTVTANADIDNPGDVDSWPTYLIEGPTTTVSVGVDGRLVEVPFALLAGETLTIDTDPTAQTAIDQDGVERTSDLGAADFAPVPPGSSVPLDVDIVGTGSVTVTLPSLFYRAW